MPAYTDKAAMIERFGERELIELTDRAEPRTGVIDDAVLDRAVAEASDLIDAHVGSRYRLPLSVVPRSLERIAADLARYFLYDNEAPDAVEKRHEDALAFLKSVSRGDVQLGAAPTGEQVSGGNLPEMESGGTVWNRKDSGGFV